MCTVVHTSFQLEVDEYVNRQKFRKRLRSWLSAPKNNWLDSATDGRRSTREYSYDTEPLDVLLRLNGLQETWQASLSSSHSSSNMSIAAVSYTHLDVYKRQVFLHSF